MEISEEITTEADRVKFLQTIAQVMISKARMKLNIKKLYAADGAAVKELLKVASLLYKATQKAGDMDEVSTLKTWRIILPFTFIELILNADAHSLTPPTP